MDIDHAIETRRTIHKFDTKIVPEEIIDKAVYAANQAPCHRLTFPWRFTKVGVSQRDLLANLFLEIKSKGEVLSEKKYLLLKSKINNPSHLIVASQIKSDNPIYELEDYAACACAIQNLSLSLAASAVGSKWSTGGIINHMTTYKIIKIDPFIEKIIGLIFIGYGEIPAKIVRPNINSIYRKS